MTWRLKHGYSTAGTQPPHLKILNYKNNCIRFFKFNFVNSLMYYDITIVLTLVLLNISGGVFKEHLFKTVLSIQ